MLKPFMSVFLLFRLKSAPNKHMFLNPTCFTCVHLWNYAKLQAFENAHALIAKQMSLALANAHQEPTTCLQLVLRKLV